MAAYYFRRHYLHTMAYYRVIASAQSARRLRDMAKGFIYTGEMTATGFTTRRHVALFFVKYAVAVMPQPRGRCRDY